jgi:hypothetical protein
MVAATSLRDRRRLILTSGIPTIVMSVMLFGIGEIRSKDMTSAREEDPVVMVGLWPLYGIGPLRFMFVQ